MSAIAKEGCEVIHVSACVYGCLCVVFERVVSFTCVCVLYWSKCSPPVRPFGRCQMALKKAQSVAIKPPPTTTIEKPEYFT